MSLINFWRIFGMITISNTRSHVCTYMPLDDCIAKDDFVEWRLIDFKT